MHKLLMHLMLWFTLINPSFATPGSDEINHLLNFTIGQGCVFEHNGNHYDPVRAKAHSRRNYDLFKDRISSTEDFIRHAVGTPV